METKEIKKEDNNVLETFEEKEKKFMKRIPLYCAGIIAVIFVGLAVSSPFYMDYMDYFYVNFYNFHILLVLLLGGALGWVWIGYYVIGEVIGILYRKYLKLQESKNIRAYSGVYAFILVVSMIGILAGLFSVNGIYNHNNFFSVIAMVRLVVVVVVVVVFGGVLGGVFGGVLGGVFGGVLGGVFGGGGVLILGMIFNLFSQEGFIVLASILVGVLVLGLGLILIRAKILGYKGLIGHTNMSTSIRMGTQLGAMLIFIPVLCIVMWWQFLLGTLHV